MRMWQWIAVLLTVMLLAACQPVMPPAAGEPPSAPEETAVPSEEGAAAPAGLTGVTWEWVRTQAADGSEVTAEDPSRYTLTFQEGGRVDAQFDCNSGGGDYSVDGESLTFGPLATTLMACPEDSQDIAFAQGLNGVASVAVDGETLTLGLADGGEMVFRAAGAEAAPAATEEPAEEATAEPAEEATEEPTEEPAEEGAAPGESSLVGVTWQWIETVYGDESVVTAADPARYTLTFMDDGSLAAQVDCNRGMGSFTSDGASLTIGPLATTRMACPEDSQANVFLQDLERTATFVFDGPNLVLNMMMDSGNIYFAPVP